VISLRKGKKDPFTRQRGKIYPRGREEKGSLPIIRRGWPSHPDAFVLRRRGRKLINGGRKRKRTSRPSTAGKGGAVQPPYAGKNLEIS